MIDYHIDMKYDKATKTLYIYNKISVRLFLYYKRRYEHIEVREIKKEKRW